MSIGLTMAVDRSPWWLVIPLVVYGLGLGFASAQLTNVVLADVPPLKSGQASAMTSTFRQVGSAFGAAVLGAVLFSGLGTILGDDLAGQAGLTDKQRSQLTDQVEASAGQAIIGLEQVRGWPAVVDDAKDAYTVAARDTAWVAAAFVLFGLLVSFGLPHDPRQVHDRARAD